MPNESETSSPSYVPGFIYLDMDQVKSISARMGGGYIKEQIEASEEFQEESESLRARVMASIFNIGAEVEGEISETEGESSRSESIKGLHHYHFTLLESELEDAEGEWFHDLDSILSQSEMSSSSAQERLYQSQFRESISEGDIIRVQGDVEVSDVSTSLEFMGGFVSMMSRLQEFEDLGIGSFDMENTMDDDSKFAEMDWNTREQAFQLIFSTISNILPDEYENMIIAELFPLEDTREHSIWSILDGDKLEGKPVELLAKFEERKIPNCTMLARVDTITRNPANIQDSDDLDSSQLGMLHHIVDGLAADMGMKVSYPSISATPIAIYR